MASLGWQPERDFTTGLSDRALVSRQRRLGARRDLRRLSRLGRRALRVKILILGRDGQVGRALQQSLRRSAR